MSEHIEQVKVINWARSHKYEWPCLCWLHAIPNGGLRNKRVAVKMKAEGATAGVSDLFLPCPSGAYNGLYIEMKYKYNKLTDSQYDFLLFVREHGYAGVVMWGADDAIEVLQAYLDLEKNQKLESKYLSLERSK